MKQFIQSRSLEQSMTIVKISHHCIVDELQNITIKDIQLYTGTTNNMIVMTFTLR